MWYKISQKLSLIQELYNLKPQIASAAQMEYDNWEQDEDGNDEEFGSGGICDEIADSIIGVVNGALLDTDTDTIYDDEIGHVFCHIWRETTQEAAVIDIPASVYETGSFYTWKKIPNVRFTPNEIVIYSVPYSDVSGGF